MVFIATGWQSVWSDLIKFFIQAALLTFGGAYSVIAFVHDNAVENYGWLSSSDMAFGIALGETTPGPLIMVNTFVGYLATDSSGWAFGLLGAVLVTVTMFVPSFVLVLAGIGLMSRQAVFNRLRRISTYVSPILIALMFSMSADLLRSYADTSNALLGIVSTAASWVLLKKFPAPPLIVGSVVLGTVTTLLVG